MPYIKQSERERLNHITKTASCSVIGSPGNLNYLITNLCLDYIEENFEDIQQANYHTLNEVIGVLECSKLELYRRLAAPYEDKKIKENGDVYS